MSRVKAIQSFLQAEFATGMHQLLSGRAAAAPNMFVNWRNRGRDRTRDYFGESMFSRTRKEEPRLL